MMSVLQCSGVVWCSGLTDGSHIGEGSQYGAEATSRDRGGVGLGRRHVGPPGLSQSCVSLRSNGMRGR
uniref:Secreted protein n=1 Tax=Mesocestoides corti TaxID=53468 RepID=A0A5K3FDA9_MESCO